jgi:hypothetical protein
MKSQRFVGGIFVLLGVTSALCADGPRYPGFANRDLRLVERLVIEVDNNSPPRLLLPQRLSSGSTSRHAALFGGFLALAVLLMGLWFVRRAKITGRVASALAFAGITSLICSSAVWANSPPLHLERNQFFAMEAFVQYVDNERTIFDKKIVLVASKDELIELRDNINGALGEKSANQQ